MKQRNARSASILLRPSQTGLSGHHHTHNAPSMLPLRPKEVIVDRVVDMVTTVKLLIPAKPPVRSGTRPKFARLLRHPGPHGWQVMA